MQLCSLLALQLISFVLISLLALQLCNITALHHCSFATLQLCSFGSLTALQFDLFWHLTYLVTYWVMIVSLRRTKCFFLLLFLDTLHRFVYISCQLWKNFVISQRFQICALHWQKDRGFNWQRCQNQKQSTYTVSQEQLFLFKSTLRAQKLTNFQKMFTELSLMLWLLLLNHKKLLVWNM